MAAKNKDILSTNQDARIITSESLSRIWDGDGYRLFLSHKSNVQEQVHQLKESLRLYGVIAFVAHNDVQPTMEWQGEIENALFSMDALAALITKDFHDNSWTDQEVGVAYGREVKVIAVKLDEADPKGFIGRFQGLRASWDDAAIKLVEILIKEKGMIEAYIKAVEKCVSFDDGNRLAKALPFIKNITIEQANKMVLAFQENDQVRDSFGFNGKWPSNHGDGLAYHLERCAG